LNGRPEYPIIPATQHEGSKQNEFERAAAEQRRGGILGELWGFMKENKKWWLLPLLMALLVLGLLIFSVRHWFWRHSSIRYFEGQIQGQGLRAIHGSRGRLLSHAGFSFAA